MLDWRHLSRKSLVGLAQQTGMCTSSTQITSKLLHLHPYKTAMFHEQYNTDHEARLNFSSWYLVQYTMDKKIPHSFCSAMKLCFISVDVRTHRLMGVGLQKIPCQSMKCHYMILRSVCLWIHLGLLGFFFFCKSIIQTSMCTHSDTNFWSTVWLKW